MFPCTQRRCTHIQYTHIAPPPMPPHCTPNAPLQYTHATPRLTSSSRPTHTYSLREGPAGAPDCRAAPGLLLGDRVRPQAQHRVHGPRCCRQQPQGQGQLGGVDGEDRPPLPVARAGLHRQRVREPGEQPGEESARPSSYIYMHARMLLLRCHAWWGCRSKGLLACMPSEARRRRPSVMQRACARKHARAHGAPLPPLAPSHALLLP